MLTNRLYCAIIYTEGKNKMPKEKELKRIEILQSKKIPQEYIYYGWNKKKIFKMKLSRMINSLERA